MICVSIQEKDYNKCREILKGCHMAELRADLCQFSIKQIEEIVSSQCSHTTDEQPYSHPT